MVDVWKLLVTDEIIDLIVKYTNDKIREDLQLKGEESDFFPLAAQIQVKKTIF